MFTHTQNKLFSELPTNDGWSFRNSKRSETLAHTHGYHRYPAKFIPQIVKKLMVDFTSPGDLVCDPFGGCGTTLVEAKLIGRNSVGFDINPVAKMITQTKVTPIEPVKLERFKKYLYSKIDAPVLAISEIKHHDRICYWFDQHTIHDLEHIFSAIMSVKDYEIRRFFLCAFSHNLKNCSRWLMKSIKPTVDKNKNIPNPYESYKRHLASMIRKNTDFYNTLFHNGHLSTDTKMYRTDSTKKWPVAQGTVDLVITSPPYVTSYEYADLHQISLFWFGDYPQYFKHWCKHNQEFSDFRRTFIGTSTKAELKGIYNSGLAQDIVNRLAEKDRALSIDVSNYFIDMKKVFSQMYTALRPGGVASIIIGNTKLKGVDILNAEVVDEQMRNAGFITKELIKRELSNKMITPWRDLQTGKFTSLGNPNKLRVYEFEYISVMMKPKS